MRRGKLKYASELDELDDKSLDIVLNMVKDKLMEMKGLKPAEPADDTGAQEAPSDESGEAEQNDQDVDQGAADEAAEPADDTTEEDATEGETAESAPVTAGLKDRDLMSDTGGKSKSRDPATTRVPRLNERNNSRGKLQTKETRKDVFLDDVENDPDLD